MNSKISFILAVSAAMLIGCDKNTRIDTNALGNLVGGQGGHLIKAGGHAFNAMALSERDELALGESVGVALTNQYPLVEPESKLGRYVSMVGFAVASASPRAGGTWVFGILDTPEVNAFSGPGGFVFITSGALAHMKDEAELAGVLAHEIAHVCNHDGLHQVQAAEQRGAISEGMKAGTRDQQFAALADVGVEAITKQGYTQPQEFDADKSGVTIMAAAGYDPASYLRYLQRLQAQGAARGGGKLMSTHPGIRERVTRVSNQLGTVPAGGATLAQRFDANTRK